MVDEHFASIFLRIKILQINISNDLIFFENLKYFKIIIEGIEIKSLYF